jgi:hypothetical protein
LNTHTVPSPVLKSNEIPIKNKTLKIVDTKQKQEIDFLEDSNGQITAFEFKWQSKVKVKIPAVFLKDYNAIGHVIDKENFREFVRFEH